MTGPRRVIPAEDGLLEQWIWEDEQPLETSADLDEDGTWIVGIEAAEFVRGDEVEDAFFAAVTAALLRVEGVHSAEQDDREVWLVTGRPHGGALLAGAREAIQQHRHLITEF